MSQLACDCGNTTFHIHERSMYDGELVERDYTCAKCGKPYDQYDSDQEDQ